MHSIIDFLKNLHDSGHLQEMVRSGGVPLIALIVFAETGLLVGFFLPGDTMLFVAGVAAATLAPNGETYLNIWVLTPALIAAAVIGDQLGYFLGKQDRARHFTREEGFFFRRKHAEKAHAFYIKYGIWAVILAKFAPVLRTFVPFMAGVGEMNYRKYLLIDTLAVIAWVCLVVLPATGWGNARRRTSITLCWASRSFSMLPVIIGVAKEFLFNSKTSS